MYFPSRLHNQGPMGRFVSVVTSQAQLNGAWDFFTHRLRVSFQGLMKAMYLPSGEICAPVISGFPNNSSRSMRAGADESCAASVGVSAANTRSVMHRFFKRPFLTVMRTIGSRHACPSFVGRDAKLVA